MKKIIIVVLNYEQVGMEEYKTIPHVKEFSIRDNFADVLSWIRTIDPQKSLMHAYITDVDVEIE